MIAKDLRGKTISELNKSLADKLKELEKVVQDVYKGKDKNIVKSGFIRKDIARIKTILTEKQFIEEQKNA